MAAAQWDFIVVGQGLAGTTLAWHLREAGQSVLLVDPQPAVTTSRIAAGLITPITGLRLVPTPDFEPLFAEARAFYGRIEMGTGGSFFHERQAVRLFVSDQERASWERRRVLADYQRHLVSPQPVPLPDFVRADLGNDGFAMHSAQLDVAAYLDASRKFLPSCAATIDWLRDVAFDDDGVPIHNHRARYVISCEGFAAHRNPFFAGVRFQAAKGEILTVRFDCALPAQIMHRGLWIAPTTDNSVFKVGSTYDLTTLDETPTAEARRVLESQLTALLRVPFAVLDHQAAVRPIIRQSQALIGLHPTISRLGYFNGLGSKGALHAPTFGRRLAEYLVGSAPLAPAWDIREYLSHAARH